MPTDSIENPVKTTDWKLTLAYDGTDFFGWQIQPELPTIQGTLADAIRKVTGESVIPQGSGRTDTGVHALAQVASLSLQISIPPENLQRALNNILPGSIRVLFAEAVPGFRARANVHEKTYVYRILRSTPTSICPPTLCRYVWNCSYKLDFDYMAAAALHVIGEHDFTSFVASDPDRATRLLGKEASNVRRIYRSEWTKQEDELVYRVTGNGFLHHMVRNLVGTFVEIGMGSVAPDAIHTILAVRDRKVAGKTAPARGLALESVLYEEQP